MIKAIIFDCFGVLVGKSYWDVWKLAGGDPVKDGEFIESMLNKANAGAISKDLFIATMSGKLGITPQAYQDIYNREEQPNQPLFDYIATELKPKYKIAILSNVNSGVIEGRIPANLRQLFDVIVVSADVDVQKPDPAIFELTANKLGVQLDETVFTDDQPRYVTPAIQLGMHGIVYSGFDGFKQQLKPLLS